MPPTPAQAQSALKDIMTRATRAAASRRGRMASSNLALPNLPNLPNLALGPRAEQSWIGAGLMALGGLWPQRL